MSALSDGWRDGLDEVDAALIDGYQSGFPVEERPFRVVADELGIDEDDALARVRRLREQGIFRRFGPVLNPPVIGSSTLAAVSAPDDRFDEIAELINGYQQVNHNYRRAHEWNMWFVVTAGSRETRDHILTEIEERTGCEVLNLPMLTDYYIDLEFPIMNDDRFARESLDETEVSATRISENATGNLSDLDARLLVEIQGGFPLSKTPYRDVAEAIDADTDAVVSAIERLLADGCIKRIGCVVNHIVTGFRNNCMVVWDVPDDELDDRGELVGSLPYVTLCYHRPRRPDQDWPYSLFTMIHGRDPDAVDEKIDELADEYLPFDHERLYSTEKLKQTGAQYETLVSSDE
ncbi:Lrp/AsnC family transcriptional regulator [Haloferax mediterranei ATCC 33500]|uniref:siroheme decarboxylase n=1 Tax=Haloferax mediterranei (strain ATCC 33500 / DSM 1411 / JCM 8866 / NBRC 14739 / NCIMB 2177 / R-4) TaxID=523841 RepID=I3R6V6_HALMT|nr:Lrp/AsnC family transcriptional regulator [Haloferax mediterranei]AFK19966.1 heme biosynthesis protein nirDL [Haloferax mediterranei ATCC 33500]AHZ23343.1 heme biosynthesis protein [Haloferax mediterranei ATCC 33500]ELZ99511.1 heme biosynthesis protein nirDL [Haloferax mediterranei ATCC 33500]MDX5987283.1 Lrp/AsnC family transcriptional regulator [Haloferax mediterranei ATCC 33500]QCQ73804.1 Lrp/AsnC family transcriptional regulator [Haloferax mediterranei ATCC 33500]